MADKITATIPGAEVELVDGERGVFTVIADGDEVWNKWKRGGFPDEDALVAQLAG